MTENLDPGTATRAALAEEIARLRLQLVERDDAVKFMTRMRDKAELERDEARQEINRLREELRQVLRDAPFAANFRQARKLLDDTLVRAEQAEAERDAYLQIEESNVEYVEQQRDEVRRDLAAATTALQRIRKLCVGRRTVATDAIRAVLAAAGDDPVATGGQT